MGSKEPGEEPPTKPQKTRHLPTWGRIGEFVLNILKLEGNVEALQKDNKELDKRVQALQRQLDEQAGKLEILSDFVTKALEDRVRSQAEEAAIRAFERMATFAAMLPERNQSEEDK